MTNQRFNIHIITPGGHVQQPIGQALVSGQHLNALLRALPESFERGSRLLLDLGKTAKTAVMNILNTDGKTIGKAYLTPEATAYELWLDIPLTHNTNVMLRPETSVPQTENKSTLHDEIAALEPYSNTTVNTDELYEAFGLTEEDDHLPEASNLLEQVFNDEQVCMNTNELEELLGLESI